MAETPEPSHSSGSDDVLAALGLASSNFARLEGILCTIFTNVFDLNGTSGPIIFSRMGNEAVQDVLSRFLPSYNRSDRARDDLAYFIQCFARCLANRNELAHSVVSQRIDSSTRAILYRNTKKGHAIMSIPTLSELRMVADETNKIYEYGKALNNAVVSETSQVFSLSPFSWPDRPALPHRLRYSSEPWNH